MAKNRYTFIRKVAPGAKESIIFASISLAVFLIDIILSFAFSGSGGAALGALGLFALLAAVYGFMKGMRAISYRGTSYLITTLGTIYAGIMCVVWIGMFFLGVS